MEKWYGPVKPVRDMDSLARASVRQDHYDWCLYVGVQDKNERRLVVDQTSPEFLVKGAICNAWLKGTPLKVRECFSYYENRCEHLVLVTDHLSVDWWCHHNLQYLYNDKGLYVDRVSVNRLEEGMPRLMKTRPESMAIDRDGLVLLEGESEYCFTSLDFWNRAGGVQVSFECLDDGRNLSVTYPDGFGFRLRVCESLKDNYEDYLFGNINGVVPDGFITESFLEVIDRKFQE